MNNFVVVVWKKFYLALALRVGNFVFFGFGRKFAEIDSVLCISVYSPYAANYSWRILLICLNASSVFSVQAKLQTYSETTSYQ
jgi:hypothetical protein